MYVPNIIILAVKFRKICIESKVHEKEFNAIFLFTEVKVAEVVKEVVKVAEVVM